MGPESPNGRSGHAVVSVGASVFLFGGYSYLDSKLNDESSRSFHVLDTGTSMIIFSWMSPHSPD